jgi:hypothetical protein
MLRPAFVHASAGPDSAFVRYEPVHIGLPRHRAMGRLQVLWLEARTQQGEYALLLGLLDAPMIRTERGIGYSFALAVERYWIMIRLQGIAA